MTTISVLKEELVSTDSELQAVEIQIQELLERQQELIHKKTVLKNKIKQLSEDSEAGESEETETSAEAWNKQDFPWCEKIKAALRNSFKLQKFRSLQLETINATMAGKDIFLVMPTGGGKSLCYQLPAVCSEGFTLVICPLISLMEDQLMVLEQLGISATLLNASSSKEHVKWVHTEMLDKNSQLKLIYVTPEKIAKSKMFMSKLEKAYQAERLTRIAVDEVHCCSQWGHDFRPVYFKLIFANLILNSSCEPGVVRQKPSNSEDFIEDIVKIINGRYKGLSGIIYCFSQKDSEQVTISLRKLGIKADTYHANLEPKYKTKVHKGWAANEIQVRYTIISIELSDLNNYIDLYPDGLMVILLFQVVVATVAFGMGIDKPDVRFVIHHSMSKSMENYYQESGRAGRDDQKADCILYYGFGDIFRISSMVVMENVGQQKLYDMVSYCHNTNKCRRVLIAQHFDEVWDSANCNKMCDNCCREKLSFERMDVTGYCRDLIKILEQADKMSEKLTPLKLIDAWLGKGVSKLRVADVVPPTLPRGELERIIAHFILQQYLKEDFSFTAFATISYLKIGPKADLLKNEAHVITMQGRSNKKSVDKVKSPQSSNSGGIGGNIREDISETVQNSAAKKTKAQNRRHCENKPKAKKLKLEDDDD
ncbi:ATP-dependent DNA helicase Q1 [Platysternon megacephalum]|uniref:ATP-dependent DNA helicase n=1 Tax=Platysternon megacephalum TaxID=55544 RepID=A0A4D9E6S8_9SAUR|nr:ATP-dependent DNA helicase Q1 [Platysternon megacephalum]